MLLFGVEDLSEWYVFLFLLILFSFIYLLDVYFISSKFLCHKWEVFAFDLNPFLRFPTQFDNFLSTALISFLFRLHWWGDVSLVVLLGGGSSSAQFGVLSMMIVASILMMLFQSELGWSMLDLLGRSADFGYRAPLQK